MEERLARDAFGVADGQIPPDPSTFTVEHWLTRDLPQPHYLLGDLVTTTSRALVIGPTGIGKTNLGLAIAFAMAAGSSFLHWAARRPARVLYIDGEMSPRLMKERLQEAAHRQGSVPSTLWAINREDFPNLPPLNSEDGQKFVGWMIEQIGDVDAIVFDNIQSLLIGSHKEDETWAPMLPWIRDLTRRKVGQLWLHHTGHDTSKGYGDKTREWQFDTVALMKAPETPAPGRLVEFRLEFTKARERTPNNRADFEPVEIWIDENNVWQSSAAPRKRGKPPSPRGMKFYDALVNAMGASGKRRSEAANRPSVTMEQWKQECYQRRLIDPKEPENRQRALMSKYRLELIAAGLVVCNGEIAWSTEIGV
jgi:hypothetical protein